MDVKRYSGRRQAPTAQQDTETGTKHVAKSINREEEWRGGPGPGSQREEPGGAPPRRDGVYKHEGDAETDCEPDGD